MIVVRDRISISGVISYSYSHILAARWVHWLYAASRVTIHRPTGTEGPGGDHEAVASGDQGAEVGARSEPCDADQGRRDCVRRDPRQDTAAARDLAATHGRAGKVQTVAAAPRVPGPPQGALQRRQLNERRGAERRPGAAERTGADATSSVADLARSRWVPRNRPGKSGSGATFTRKRIRECESRLFFYHVDVLTTNEWNFKWEIESNF